MLFYIIYIPIVLPVQICSMLFKYAACCSDMQHVVQICSMLFRYAACCSEIRHIFNSLKLCISRPFSSACTWMILNIWVR